jgi:putative cell wall-binding protein
MKNFRNKLNSKSLLRRMLAILVITCVISTALFAFVGMLPDSSVEAAGRTGIYRIAGSNRFDTSCKVADQVRAELGGAPLNAIVVACGTSYPDALSGSYLAAAAKGPILLVDGTNFKSAADYIKSKMDPQGTVYILGGNSAVTGELELYLEMYNTVRLWGKDRFETNLAVIRKADELMEQAGMTPSEVIVCSGLNYPDAISVSALGKPVLLTGAGLTENQKDYLSSFSYGERNFTIVGGNAAVPTTVDSIFSSYGSVQRISGKDRYETSVKVAEHFFPAAREAVMAYALSFPDGLSGGLLAYIRNCPIILSANEACGRPYNYELSKGMTSVTILGGERLIENAAAGLPQNANRRGFDLVGGYRYHYDDNGYISMLPFTKYGYTVTPNPNSGRINYEEYKEMMKREDLHIYGSGVIVDLSEQTLWYLQDGVVLLSTPVVTGKPGFETPQGTFKILAHARDVNLKGEKDDEEWDVDVNYWMPFKGNYFGFHDATWRYYFGGTIYLYNGSHGCVNLPFEKMKQFYTMVPDGARVVIRA